MVEIGNLILLKLNKNYRYARLYALRINRSRSVCIYTHIQVLRTLEFESREAFANFLSS